MSSDLSGSTQAFNFSNNATIHTSIYDVENRQYTDTAANIVLDGNTEISDTTVTGSGTLTLSGTTTASGTINLEGSSNLSISSLLANSTISFTGATASNLTISSVSVNPANHQLLLKEGSESAIKYGTHVDSATTNGNGFMYFATYVLFDGFAWTGDNANVDQFIVSTDDTHTYLTVDTPASIFYVNNGNHCFSSESAETTNKTTKYVVANGATLTLDAGSVNGRTAATALTMATGTGTIKYDAQGTVIINNAGMAADFTGTFDLTSGTIYVGNKTSSGNNLDNGGGDTTFNASKVIVRTGATFLTHLGSDSGKDFAPSFDLMNGATFGNRDGHVNYTGNFRFNIVDPSADTALYDSQGVVTMRQYWDKTLHFTGRLEGDGTVVMKATENGSWNTCSYKLSNNGNTFAGTYSIQDSNANNSSANVTTLVLAATNAAQYSTVSLDTVKGISVLQLNQNSTIAGLNSAVGANSANKVTASADATLTVNGGGSYAGLLQNGSGVLSLTKTGAETLTLSGNVGAENAALGTITVTNGHLALNGTSWVNNVTLNGDSGQTGHLTYGGGVTHTIAGTLMSSNHNRTAGSVTVEAGTTLNVGYLNNCWGMNMVVNGEVSTFAIDGNTDSDKVRLASNSTASITGEGSLTTNNLLVENSASDYTINLNQLNIRDSLTIQASSQLHLGSNTTTIGGAVTLKNANNTLSFEKGTATVSGAVTNDGTINVLDGSVYLNGGISGSGKVVLSGGALSFASGVTNELSQFNYSGGTLSHSGLTVTNAEFSGITLDNSANTAGALNITGNLNVTSVRLLTQVENNTPPYSYTAKEGETVNTGNGFAIGSFYVINGGTITGDYTVQLNGTELSFAELGQGTGNYASKAENSIIITLNGDTTGTFYAMTPAGTDDSGNLIPSVAINRNTAGSYFVASGAVLKFIDSLAEAEVWEKQISGEGTVQLSITNANRHDAGLKFGSGFNGVVEIAGGKMRFEHFNLGRDATVKLYTGEVWNYSATTFANKLIMAGSGEDAFLVKGGTLTLTGAVTGTNLKTETGLILTNAANNLDMLKVVNGTTQISAGSYGQVKVTSGTVNASGGNIGHLNATGGTITLSGTATVDGTGDTGNYRMAGIYAEGGTINIGNEVDDYTLVAPRVETGNGGASKLNIKQNATLVVTGSDFEGETDATENGYWKTGFILGEWSGSSVLTVKGTLLVQNAHIEHGDATGTINIENGGVVATQGIRGGINKGAPNASGRIELNLKDGGKLILGEGGIDAQNLTSNLAAGTIGISADNVTIADNLTLSSTIGTTFDTQKHVWTGEGTTLAVNRGDTGGNLLISGAISGDGKLIKTGSGTLTLSAANTYTGATRVEGGELVVTKSNANSSSSYYIAEEAKLKVDAFSGEWNKTITGNGTLSIVIARTENHGNKLTGIGDFTGVLEISKAEGESRGNINLTAYTLADDVSLRLISGNNWSTSNTDTILITQNIELAGKTKEDFMFLHENGKTLELSGVVTGTYLTSGESYNGYYKEYNHYNDLTLSGENSRIDHVYMFESSTLTVNADMFFGTITADNVVIGNETVLTLGGGEEDSPVAHSIGKLSATSAGVTLGNYATLTLGGGTADAHVIHNIGTINAGANSSITLSSNATLNAFSKGTGIVALKGSGILDLGNATTTYNTVVEDSNRIINDAAAYKAFTVVDGWTGTIRISGAQYNGNRLGLNLNNLSNANSAVELANVNGWFTDTMQGKLILTKSTDESGNELAAWYISNGGSKATNDASYPNYVMSTFAGAVSGDGKMAFTWDRSDSATGIKFTGNVADWTGAFEMAAAGNGIFNLVFEGNANTINADITRKIGMSNHVRTHVKIDDANSTASDKTINMNGSVDAANMTLGAASDSDEVRAVINLNNDVTLSDTLTNYASTTLAKGKTISAATVSNSGTLKLGDTATITKAEGKTAASMENVKLSEEGIASADETKATKGSVTDAKVTLAALAAGTSFSIEDVTLTNVNIEAENADDRVNLSGVSATDVQLTKGEFHMLDKAQPQVGTGGSAINLVEGGPTGLDFSTSLLNGMTLGVDASMVVDLGDLSGFTGMDSGKPTFSITLEGFRLSDYTGTGENKGLYFASDSWLGKLLQAQGASQYVKGDTLDAGAQASTGSGSGVSVSYTSTAVGTVITISGLQVPEPATSTLGLIALTALVSRRRRK